MPARGRPSLGLTALATSTELMTTAEIDVSSPPMGMSEAIHRVSQSPFVDAFLLRRAERTVASFPESQQGKMRELFGAAELRSVAADELFEGQAPAAFPLFARQPSSIWRRW